MLVGKKEFEKTSQFSLLAVANIRPFTHDYRGTLSRKPSPLYVSLDGPRKVSKEA